jgi:hypothetical protein
MTEDLITFEDVGDLEGKIHTLYNELDEDNSGGLSYEEFRQMAMQLVSTISLTRDDWNIITENGKHLGPADEFNQEQFVDMMKGELLRYSRRQLNNVLTVSGDETDRSVILMLKLFEADSKSSLEKQQASLAQQQASLAQHEDKLALMQQDIQTVLLLLQGGSNPRPGMNPVDVGSPKALSEELPVPEISESTVLDVDFGFMVGGATSAAPEQPEHPPPLKNESAHVRALQARIATLEELQASKDAEIAANIASREELQVQTQFKLEAKDAEIAALHAQLSVPGLLYC